MIPLKSKKLVLNLVVVGMTLGTAWAVRGQFGHEQGAAWAGGIAAICILLLAEKQAWYNRAFKIGLAAAIGWGLGGMMSYGRVVGYGRGTDFFNVYYGFAMLFVIGGLYGFLGGGLFGLSLSNPKSSKVDWSRIISEMVVWALITYFFLVMQWEFLMTPPRSELWAACLGMGIALTWYLIRTENFPALRVALYSGLGAGFGFAFGNFLQVLGNVSGIAFNFWNVMEYSLGFFGGVGMAYGTFTSQWDFSESDQKRTGSMVPILLMVLFIPLIVWSQSFEIDRLTTTYQEIMTGNVLATANLVRIGVLILILGYTAGVLRQFYWQKDPLRFYLTAREVKYWFALHFGSYILLSLLITGALVSGYRIEQYLYLVNFSLVLFLLPKLSVEFVSRSIHGSKIWWLWVLIIILLAILALIATNSHGEIGGMQERF